MSCASPIPRPSPCVLRSPSSSQFTARDELPQTPPIMAPRSPPFGLHAFSFAPLPSARSPCSSCSCTDSLLSCRSCLCALASSKSRSGGGSSSPLRAPSHWSSSHGQNSPLSPVPAPATPTFRKGSPIYSLKLSDQIASSAERSRSVLGSLDNSQFSTPERCSDECGGQTIGSRGKEDHRSLERSLTFRKDGNSMAKPETSSLKRKRPPKLSIPECASLVALGRSLLYQDAGQEHLENSSVENSMYGVVCKKGRKNVMEDTHSVVTNFQGNPDQAFFGVFDGHGGRNAAEFAAENLPNRIADAIEKLKTGKEDVEEAIRTAYLTTDAAFLDKRVGSGACSVSALVKDGQLVVANAGDCRAVLSKSGNAEALTKDHRAGQEEERTRIETLGGYVDCFNGVWRVQGTLCVTRSFGDMHLKRWICAEPDVRKLELTQDCEFLILASDGLWDQVSDQEAVDCARASLGLETARDASASKAQKLHDSSTASSRKDGPEKGTSLAAACQKLVKMASDRGSIDDITVLIVPLRGFFFKTYEQEYLC